MGYNQSDLGRALGLTFQQVQKYEKGSNRISSSKLWEIAQFLEVDIGYFFIGLDSPHTALAGGSVDRSEHKFPATRYTVEIARLAPELSGPQQKLTLEIIRSLSDKSASAGK